MRTLLAAALALLAPAAFSAETSTSLNITTYNTGSGPTGATLSSGWFQYGAVPGLGTVNWPVLELEQGGAVLGPTNGLYIQPGTGATFPVTGTFWQTTQPVSLASLPALSSGSNVIGAVTQSGGPWTVSWSGQSVGVSSLPALVAGSATIGKVDLLGNAGTALDSAAGTSNGQALTVQGNASGVPVPDNQTQINGNAVATGTGASNSGTQRVVTASDSPNAPFSAVSIGSLTRSANTTTYAIYTGWNNSSSATSFTFAGACRVNGGSVLIPEIDIYSSVNPTVRLAGVLWLFSAVPGTLIADASSFTIASADFANVTGPMQGVGFSLGNTQATGASNSAAALTGTTWHAQCASGSTSISGMVEVTNAYTPASGETLTVKLHTVGVN